MDITKPKTMIQARRLFDIPYYQLETYPRSDMFVTKTNGEWFGVSIQQFLEEAMCVSRGLIAFGVAPGDTVALVSNNRVEWNIMDIAIQQIGAIVVPLYPNISENDYRYILNDAKVKMCFVGNSELCTKIQNIRNSVPSLEHLFSFEIIASCPNWKSIHQHAEEVEEAAVLARMEVVQSHDLATVIYTSGTTGNPKGVMLSHHNILSNVSGCVEPIPADHTSRVLSFLPVCHIYERMLHYLYMHLGCSIYFAESMETIGENIKEVKPHVFSAVPRLIEKVFDKIMAKGEDLTGIKHRLFFWAVSLGEQYDVVGKSVWYKFKLAIARKLIF